MKSFKSILLVAFRISAIWILLILIGIFTTRRLNESDPVYVFNNRSDYVDRDPSADTTYFIFLYANDMSLWRWTITRNRLPNKQADRWFSMELKKQAKIASMLSKEPACLDLIDQSLIIYCRVDRILTNPRQIN